ncbi:MAG: hypothetical protein HN826_09185 [Methylococcales bacterium]|nr:hypothetical protein [Methylococcales bacterium]
MEVILQGTKSSTPALKSNQFAKLTVSPSAQQAPIRLIFTNGICLEMAPVSDHSIKQIIDQVNCLS